MTTHHVFWILVVAVVLLYQFVDADTFDDAINSRMQQLKIRGMAIAFYDESTMNAPVARGYGKVSSSPTSADVDADTTFQLASVSKVFTASAIAVLLDQGQLKSLDDDICSVKPSTWQTSACRNPHHPKDKVTFRMMMSHRSSFQDDIPQTQNKSGVDVAPSYGPSFKYDPEIPAAGNPTCPLTDVQGFYRDILTEKKTETKVGYYFLNKKGRHINWYYLAKNELGGMWSKSRPGATKLYSNFAVGYQAALVELKTNQTFPQFCKTNIFDKLNMTHTAWHTVDLPPGTKQAIPNQYREDTDDWTDYGDYCYIDYASGELRTTANDLVKWGNAMLTLGVPSLWSSTTGDEVAACQERNENGVRVKNCEFGLGWAILNNKMKSKLPEKWLGAFTQYDWTDGIWHDGSEAGIQSNLIVLPSAGVYVAVVTQTDENDDEAPQKMTARVMKAPRPVT